MVEYTCETVENGIVKRVYQTIDGIGYTEFGRAVAHALQISDWGFIDRYDDDCYCNIGYNDDMIKNIRGPYRARMARWNTNMEGE